MCDSNNRSAPRAPYAVNARELTNQLRSHFTAQRDVRRAVCLLNAGEYERAAETFARAQRAGYLDDSLPSYLAACRAALGQSDEAADSWENAPTEIELTITATIRRALALWQANRRESAIECLRRCIESNTESAELHFQLGTLLSRIDDSDEAELRFTQAVSIDADHSRAAVSLALCCAARHAPHEALKHLQRAQTQRPHDPRIGLLLAQAAKATRQSGRVPCVRATMPGSEPHVAHREIQELARIIEHEPDFVDALLSIPISEVDGDVYTLLLATLDLALERQPEHAELHFHCGQVLERLGRQDEAIHANERAIELDPRFIRALIQLGKLYRKTARTNDATRRIEQAIAAGAEYADVHFLLGNLYRDQGETIRARRAYHRALTINERFKPARDALGALTV